VIAATIVMVLMMAFLANLMVQRKLVPRTGLAYLGLFLSLLVGYFYARNHELVAFASPLANLMVSCVLLTVRCSFRALCSRP